MAKPPRELWERLLQAGIAPRHVRRYLRELTDHLADLTVEEERAGRDRQEAESAALARLGKTDDLARAMIEQRQFQSWSARAPWAMFGLVPLTLLAGAYFAAALYLWCGWRIFLPGADTPFIRITSPLWSFANIYFQAGRAFYYTAPLLVGWAIAVAAARQRLRTVWPIIALGLIAGMGATAEIQASRSAVPGGLGHIRMSFFGFGPSGQAIAVQSAHALAIFTLTALPFLLWRLQKIRSLPGR